MAISYDNGPLGRRVVGPIRRTLDGGLTRTDEWVSADGSDREPSVLHVAAVDDVSNENRTLSPNECGWCWLGAPHSQDAHDRKVAARSAGKESGN